MRKARLDRRPPDAATIVLAVVLLVATAAPARAVFRTETKFSADQHDDWEPHIAADDAGHLYWSTTRYSGRKACKSCPDPAIVYRVSDDNGISWSKPRFICRCPGVGGQHDPVFTTDDQGRVFAIWMNDFEVNFARSDDFGNTWTRHGPLDGILRYSDKPWIATSHDGEDVYVTFNANGRSPRRAVRGPLAQRGRDLLPTRQDAPEKRALLVLRWACGDAGWGGLQRAGCL